MKGQTFENTGIDPKLTKADKIEAQEMTSEEAKLQALRALVHTTIKG
jgi:hypothetical protein